MIKVKVRYGYCLHIGPHAYEHGSILDVTQEVYEGQSWKLEPVEITTNGARAVDTKEEDKHLDEPPEDKMIHGSTKEEADVLVKRKRGRTP